MAGGGAVAGGGRCGGRSGDRAGTRGEGCWPMERSPLVAGASTAGASRCKGRLRGVDGRLQDYKHASVGDPGTLDASRWDGVWPNYFQLSGDLLVDLYGALVVGCRRREARHLE